MSLLTERDMPQGRLQHHGFVIGPGGGIGPGLYPQGIPRRGILHRSRKALVGLQKTPLLRGYRGLIDKFPVIPGI